MDSAGSYPRGSRLASILRRAPLEERGLTALLALLAVYHIGLPLVSGFELSRLVTACFLTMLAVSGVVAVTNSRFVSRAMRLVAPAVMIAAWAEVAYPTLYTRLASCAADMTLLSFLLATVAEQVFRAGPVTAHRIRGAVAIYLLIGGLFAFVYFVLLTLQPGAIRLSSSADAQSPQSVRAEMSYFSLVTLATVGYGDVTPVSPLARSVATLEAITGQLYIAITLARLVSSQTSVRGEGSLRSPDDRREVAPPGNLHASFRSREREAPGSNEEMQ